MSFLLRSNPLLRGSLRTPVLLKDKHIFISIVVVKLAPDTVVIITATPVSLRVSGGDEGGGGVGESRMEDVGRETAYYSVFECDDLVLLLPPLVEVDADERVELQQVLVHTLPVDVLET